ncbi:hypothetical protein HPB49_005130 [Dermacentor silvarum]|uniref:Uncharacterized protein n=1 Tax=Dermacentor silvarum TaxID=543639 RepID=A0ACB8CDI6_DERSI|nr:hypothetical protein HPB49_005130 [Dermacentor silvarum]
MAAKCVLVPWPALLVVVYPWCLLVTAGQSHGLSFQAAAPPATCLHVPRREVLQGSSVSVPCAGADHDNGGQIRWYKEGKPVLPVQQGPLAINGSSLRLTQLGSADSGCYQCLRDNGRWSSYALEVIAFPSARIRWQLQDQWGPASSAAAGTTVLLSGTGSLLRVEALDRRHHGMKIRCTASRPVAGAASAAVTLDIYPGPTSRRAYKTKRRGPLVAGVPAELECVAWGSRPEPTLRWTLGGRPLASAFSHWDGRNVSTATVTLRPAPADNGRRLVCAASNARTPAIPPVQDSRRLDVHCKYAADIISILMTQAFLGDFEDKHPYAIPADSIV